jgi:hypothetical protein
LAWPLIRITADDERQSSNRRETFMSASQSTAPASIRRSSSIWRHWPVAVGVLGAAFAAIASPDRETIVISLLVALICYLAAAALGVRWVAWAAIPVASALVVAGALIGIEPWFVLGGVAIALVIVGLVARASRTALAAQSLALVAYGGIALIGLALSPVVGAVLASLTLMAHSVWDVIHYRRNAVVSRSLAEACIAFDVLLGLTAIVLAAASG